MTFRFKIHDAQNLNGFINTLTSNGYQVNFREGGNARILMCDVIDDKCKIRDNEQNEEEKEENGKQKQ